MKQSVVAILAVVTMALFSCDKEERFFDKTYEYRAEACISTNPELNACIEWVSFSEGSRAGYLPHGDIVMEATYKVKGSRLTVYNANTKKAVYEFKLSRKEDALIEVSSGNRWTRSENN